MFDAHLSAPESEGRAIAVGPGETSAAARLSARVIPTPDSPHPFAVEIISGGDVVRRKPVESASEADRVLIRLLEDAATDGLGGPLPRT